ncbi:MAG: undecaprenyl-phosphate glucose phosphotransferase [Gaiellales bacterium]|nr:MAG: undecaprenyl-phosphate glucose phosphotransferase [Gaiellales bacterium]
MKKAKRFFTSHRFAHASLVIGDLLGVVLAYRLAFLAYFQLGFWIEETGSPSPSAEFYLAVAFVILPFYWLLFKLFGLYRFRLNLSLLEILPHIISAVTLGSMVLLSTTIVIFPPVHYSRNVIVLSWLLMIVCVSLMRFIVYHLQKLGRRHGWYMKRTLVLGAGSVGLSCVRKIQNDTSLGLKFVGFLDQKPSRRVVHEGEYRVFDDYDQLESVLETYRIQHMIVAFSRDRHDQTVNLMERCRPYGVEFTVVPRLYEVFSDRVGVEHIRGLPVIGLKRGAITGLQALFKRAMDITISLFTLVVAAPVMLLTMVSIRIDSPGPIFYQQVRLGKNERPFRMLKFRSMRRDAERGEAGWSTARDVRRTRVGRIIRPLGIDELPQLVNVIRGDMSLVGPRPERPAHVESFKESIPSYAARHRVRPGLTGWAQINGLRGDTDIGERVEYDIYYIENWNPWFDIKILLRTLFAFFDRNA